MIKQPIAVNFNPDKVDRFEVIDDLKGKRYVRNDCSIEFSYQDGGKTLKIFVKEKETIGGRDVWVQ